jgi:predicted ATP-dependent endonuclease of OLD family
MCFQKGLNVIVGSNNSGKTGLLYVINMLSDPEIKSAHSFNKNVINEFSKKFMYDAPEIVFEFEIRHKISEDDIEDESIIKLLPFLGMNNKLEELQDEDKCDNDGIYNITANVKMTFSLDSKLLGDYKRDVIKIKSPEEYVTLLDTYLPHYKWKYTNGTSEIEAVKKDVTNIFDIRFIGAERTSTDVAKETKQEIERFSKEQDNVVKIQDLKKKLSNEIREILSPKMKSMSELFENENNEIGLNRGNQSIFQNIRPDIRIADAFVTDVLDTKGNYSMPLEYNGLRYNNLINIYMLIKLIEYHEGQDFRILCLEEPEAHLHPAMQYKLFKFLKKLDETDKLNQQIFVTTHSSNISAVAGLDNMFMLDYCRNKNDCYQQSLQKHFCYEPQITTKDATETKKIEDEKVIHKSEAKKHLSKFLDVTRSDMLFADNVILVEGIAEKLLLPLFMDKCNYSYEDENISIVEIGGKHFEHFIELYNENTVCRKVLCITDRDFKWIKNEEKVKTLSLYSDSSNFEVPHIEKLNERFKIGNLKIVTQKIGGKTFEDELFLTNLSETTKDIAKMLIGLIDNETLNKMCKDYGFDFDKWNNNRPNQSNSVISDYLNIFTVATTCDKKNEDKYKKLFFAEIFLYYVEKSKGDIALSILTNEDLSKGLVVPEYIKEGLKWLSK